MYFPNFGNSDLQPEKSRNLELGLLGAIGKVGYEVNVYRNWYRDLIGSDSSTFLLINVDKARITGTELILKFNTGVFHHQLDYTYLDPRNKVTGKVLTYRSWNMAKWQIDFPIRSWNLHSDILWKGHQFSSSTNRLSSYLTVNLAAIYQAGSVLKISGPIDNLFDREYQTVAEYAALVFKLT
ncbi:MAG: Vitamin B12 transporter BtuB [Candidatus Celerinatantimonas neptuna]|nr:MAG: Vitamin B12 transporter BtuB [Candidatus Celerinatantimonas neptuna]